MIPQFTNRRISNTKARRYGLVHHALTDSHERVLVTGGAGFIGSHLVDRLIADGYTVHVLDNLSTGRLENIRDHLGSRYLRFIKGDITDVSTLGSAVRGVKIVFHEAALAKIPDSMRDPIPTNEVNATGTLKLLQASIKYGVDRLIYASSSSVYGDQGEKRIKENSLPKPMSPYAVSKLAGESYCLVHSKLKKVKSVCLRYFNVYGPRQAYGPYSGVITVFQNRVRKNLPPIVNGNGKQTRDFVNVCDVVQANMLAMTRKVAVGEAFNIGTGEKTRIDQLAEMFAQTRGKSLRPIRALARPGDVTHSCADITKARNLLGYAPTKKLEDYIRGQVQIH